MILRVVNSSLDLGAKVIFTPASSLAVTSLVLTSPFSTSHWTPNPGTVQAVNTSASAAPPVGPSMKPFLAASLLHETSIPSPANLAALERVVTSLNASVDLAASSFFSTFHDNADADAAISALSAPATSRPAMNTLIRDINLSPPSVPTLKGPPRIQTPCRRVRRPGNNAPETPHAC